MAQFPPLNDWYWIEEFKNYGLNNALGFKSVFATTYCDIHIYIPGQNILQYTNLPDILFCVHPFSLVIE